MTLYDVLGVEPDADIAEIRAAYRALASEHHPDKGGDGERMSQINKAYEVLSGTESRERYDATGKTDEGLNVATEARNTLMQVFLDALKNRPDDPYAAVKASLANGTLNLTSRRRTLESQLTKLTRASGKMKARGPEDLYKGVIDQQTEAVKAELRGLEQAEEVRRLVEELFADYENFGEPAPALTAWRTGTSTYTSTTT